MTETNIAINSINIEKLEKFLTHFVDFLVLREKRNIGSECNMLRASVNEDCGTPGCHAGWIHLVLNSFCEEYVEWTTYPYRLFHYERVGYWFLCWLFDKEYNNDLGHDLALNGFSQHLWGNPVAVNMFDLGEAFNQKTCSFPATVLASHWENVLRKLKYFNTMKDILIESGYIQSDTKISNEDFIYGHWEKAKRVWEMMDASNPVAVCQEYINLFSQYRNQLPSTVFKHPLVVIALDKLNQLLAMSNYSNTDVTKSYALAYQMYMLTIVYPYGPVQPVI